MKAYNRNDPATPPRPENYKAEAGIRGGQYRYGDSGTLTCTACDEVLRRDIEAADLHGDNLLALEGTITRHNTKKHKDLLYVFTSAGWVQAGYLIPDPVKVVNDLIDKDVQSRIYGQTLVNHPDFLHK